jgi:ankyrin repeat protein
MSRDEIFSNCINLQLRKPLLSMLEDVSHVRFTNLSESFNWCCKENQVKFATDFLKFDIGGVDFNSKQEGRNGFHSACFNGHLKIVSLLLKESGKIFTEN